MSDSTRALSPKSALAERYGEPDDAPPRRYEDAEIHERLLETGRLVRAPGPLDVVLPVAAPATPPPPPPPPPPPASPSQRRAEHPGGVPLPVPTGPEASPEVAEARRRERRHIEKYVVPREYSVSMPVPEVPSLPRPPVAGDPFAANPSDVAARSEGGEYQVTRTFRTDDARAAAARMAMEVAPFERSSSVEITVLPPPAAILDVKQGDAVVTLTNPCGEVSIVRIRVVAVDERAYVLRTFGTPADDACVRAFFDSFELLEREAESMGRRRPVSKGYRAAWRLAGRFVASSPSGRRWPWRPTSWASSSSR